MRGLWKNESSFHTFKVVSTGALVSVRYFQYPMCVSASAIDNLTSFLGGVTINGKKPTEVPQIVHDLVYSEASGVIYVTDQQRITGYKWDQKTKELKLSAFCDAKKRIESIAMAPPDGIGKGFKTKIFW